MEQNKDTFLLYKNHIDSISDLSDVEKGQLLQAIFNYANNKDVKLQKGTEVFGVFKCIRNQMNYSADKWQKKCEQNRKNAQKRYIKDNNATAYECMHNDIDTDIDIDNGIDIENESGSDNEIEEKEKEKEKEISSTTTTHINGNTPFMTTDRRKLVILATTDLDNLINKVKDTFSSDNKDYYKDIIYYLSEELSSDISNKTVPRFNKSNPSAHYDSLCRKLGQKCKDENIERFIQEVKAKYNLDSLYIRDN